MTEPPFSFPALPTYSTWFPYNPGTAEDSMPPFMATTEPETSPFINIRLAVRVILFVACLIENSIAIFILCTSIKNGRGTFSRYILINIACVDILTALLLYPVDFVNFYHGEFIWVVQGHPGDVLCKMYAFLFEISRKVIILSLVALACDVTRNLSSKGRKEHTRKFSAKLIVFFWIFAASPSIMYIVISKVEWNMCWVDQGKELLAVMMQKIHSFMFEVPADLILTILNFVVFSRVRRRKREIGRKREERRAGRMKEARRRKHIGDKKCAKVQQWRNDAQEPMLLSRKSWCQPGGEYFPAATNPQQQSTSSNPSETSIEMPNETKTFNEFDEASDSHDVHDDQEDDGTISTDEYDQEESFETTREEAKITSITSALFVILSIIRLIFWYVYVGSVWIGEYAEYFVFAIETAVEIYAVIKPRIYASIDKEFRKRYTQLSPFACCCLRRMRCHKVPHQVGTTELQSLSTQEGSV